MAHSTDERQLAWGKVVAQAWGDPHFKQRLLDEPVTVLKEAGIDFSDDCSLSIVECQQNEVKLVLPPAPADVALNDQELEAVVGSQGCNGIYQCWTMQ